MRYIHGLGRLPLIEIDERGETRINIFDESGMVGVIEGNEVSYLLKDHLGSTRVVADEAGQKIGEFNYFDFGETTTSGDVEDIRYRYTGQEWDEELEEYNYLAREYDPATGRFSSPDPVRQGFSPYVYAGDNPINFVDPDGNAPKAIKWKYVVTLNSILEGPPVNRSGALRIMREDIISTGIGNVLFPSRSGGRIGSYEGENHFSRGKFEAFDGYYKFAMSTKNGVIILENSHCKWSHYDMIERMGARGNSETSLVGSIEFEGGIIKGVKVKSYRHEINNPELMKWRVEKMLGTFYKGVRRLTGEIGDEEIKVHVNVNGEFGELPPYELATREAPLPTYAEATRFEAGERIGEGARVRVPRDVME